MVIMMMMACNGDDAPDTDPVDTDAVDTDPVDTDAVDTDDGDSDAVTLSAADEYLTRDGRTEVVAGDLTAYERLEIQVRASDGTVTTLQPELDGADAIFHGVPEGSYTLVTQAAALTWYPSALSIRETSARHLDLGLDISGRADKVAATLPTPIVLDLDGLSPVQVPTDVDDAYDVVEIYSFDAGTQAQIDLDPGDASVSGVPADGATVIEGLTADWSQIAVSYPDLTPTLLEGDDLTVVHLAHHRAAEDPYVDFWSDHTWFSADSALTTTATMTDGVATTVSGTMTVLPRQSLTVALPLSASVALLDAAAPDAAYYTASFGVAREPGAPSPRIGVQGTLLSLGGTVAPDAVGDLDATFEYGDPYTAGQPLASTFLSAWYPFTDPVSGTTDRVLQWVQRSDAVADIDGVPLLPVLDLPADVTVAGQAAAVGTVLEGVGTTPEIVFTPSAGAAWHAVAVTDHTDTTDADGGLVDRRHVVARFVTAGDRVVVPEGLLVPGVYYSATVTAWLRGDGVSREYFVDQAGAQAATGLFTP